MRYDQSVTLIQNQVNDDDDSLDQVVTDVKTPVKANVQSTKVTTASGKTFRSLIVRVYCDYQANQIQIGSKIFEVQDTSKHNCRTDFTLITNEVIFHG